MTTQKNDVPKVNKTKKALKNMGYATGGAIGASLLMQTVKSSVEIDDAYVSIVGAALGLYFSTKTKGVTQQMICGASAVLGMSAISDTVTLAAQKTENPHIDKLAELLPTVQATNLLTNSTVPSLPAESDLFDPSMSSPALIDTNSSGVNGLSNNEPLILHVA